MDTPTPSPSQASDKRNFRIIAICCISLCLLLVVGLFVINPTNSLVTTSSTSMVTRGVDAVGEGVVVGSGGAVTAGIPGPVTGRGVFTSLTGGRGRSATTQTDNPIRKDWNYIPQLTNAIKHGTLKSVVVYADQQTVIATDNKNEQHQVGYPLGEEKTLIRQLQAADVPLQVTSNPTLTQPTKAEDNGMGVFGIIALLFGVMLLFGIAGAFYQRRQIKKNGGENNKKPGEHDLKTGVLKDAELPTTRFADVAGCDEAVEEVSEFMQFLRDPVCFQRMGAKMPRGILLYGPPGTGKTMLARALAGESGAAFFSVSGSEFVDRYVGVGPLRVRQLFEKARAAQSEVGGAIIFIDEIDAIARRRGGGGEGGNQEYEGTLNQLLKEMDGFGDNDRLVVVAATNRLDVLDPAVTRPGRFSRHVHIGLPSAQGRLEILRTHAKGKPLGPDVDLQQLAEATFGSSGAVLAETLNEGAIMAAREGTLHITHKQLMEGNLRVIAGPEKKHSLLAGGERETVAWHEAGHVVTAELCDGHEKALRATIRPRGQAAGLAMYGQNDRSLMSIEDVYQRLVVMLGGRAAEEIHHGKISSGASNDIQKANELARRAVEEWGFSTHAGHIVKDHGMGPMKLSNKQMEKNDDEVDRLVTDAYSKALELLNAHVDILESVAELLLAKEDVERKELLEALGDAGDHRWTGPSTLNVPEPVSQPVAEPVTVDEQPQSSRWRRRSRPSREIGGYVDALRSYHTQRKQKRQDGPPQQQGPTAI